MAFCADCGKGIVSRAARCRACFALTQLKPLVGRFWAKVDKRGPDECWPWTGCTVPFGHGQIQRGKRSGLGLTLTHRVSWELHNGPIPDGLNVLHSCDNPPCCNPKHLFLGTHGDNMADMVAKGRQDRGENHGQAKLTEDDVRMIRDTYADGGVSHEGLGKFFAVSRSTIGLIISRKNWRHVA